MDVLIGYTKDNKAVIKLNGSDAQMNEEFASKGLTEEEIKEQKQIGRIVQEINE